MTPEREVELGGRAKDILENEVFGLAHDQIKERIITEWASSPIRDVEGRERLFLMLLIHNEHKALIASTMESGKVAAEKIRHNHTMLDRAKDFLKDSW